MELEMLEFIKNLIKDVDCGANVLNAKYVHMLSKIYSNLEVLNIIKQKFPLELLYAKEDCYLLSANKISSLEFDDFCKVKRWIEN